MARPPRRLGNLPAEATSFIGRRRELAEVRKKFTEARLVSLIGPGGVGKTRLAIRAATDLGRGFPGGAWLVELAEVREPALVGHAVMAALDLRDQAATEPAALLLSYLRDKQLLLVVDNCEHLLEAAAQVLTEIMRAAPGVLVIATSREPLSVSGEHVVPVRPLDLPSVDVTFARLGQNEAVRLFVDRAAAGSGGFELTTTNQAAVIELCRRLDGLPLAIELAAVRTRVLTAAQILDRLTDRFSLLTGGGRAALPRQQTLRTTIDWSHDLLTVGEQTLLRRLGVFAGRWFDGLLAAGSGTPHAQAHFTRGFLSLLQSDPTAAGPALDRAATEAREAGQPSLQSQSLSLASIARHMAGDSASARRLLDAAHAVTADLGDFPATIALLQARALGGLIEGDLDAVRSAASEGARASREVGDLYSLDMMLVNLGCAALIAGDLDESQPPLTEALRIARRLDDRVAQYCLLDALGCHAAGSAGHGSRRGCSGRRRPCKRALARACCPISRHWWPRQESRRGLCSEHPHSTPSSRPEKA
jgi:predicted ATPase